LVDGWKVALRKGWSRWWCGVTSSGFLATLAHSRTRMGLGVGRRRRKQRCRCWNSYAHCPRCPSTLTQPTTAGVTPRAVEKEVENRVREELPRPLTDWPIPGRVEWRQSDGSRQARKGVSGFWPSLSRPRLDHRRPSRSPCPCPALPPGQHRMHISQPTTLLPVRLRKTKPQQRGGKRNSGHGLSFHSMADAQLTLGCPNSGTGAGALISQHATLRCAARSCFVGCEYSVSTV